MPGTAWYCLSVDYTVLPGDRPVPCGDCPVQPGTAWGTSIFPEMQLLGRFSPSHREKQELRGRQAGAPSSRAPRWPCWAYTDTTEMSRHYRSRLPHTPTAMIKHFSSATWLTALNPQLGHLRWVPQPHLGSLSLVGDVQSISTGASCTFKFHLHFIVPCNKPLKYNLPGFVPPSGWLKVREPG